MVLDRRKLLSQSDFLAGIETSPPSDSASDASLTEFLSFDLEEAAGCKLSRGRNGGTFGKRGERRKTQKHNWETRS
jgi:hypothetical protein